MHYWIVSMTWRIDYWRLENKLKNDYIKNFSSYFLMFLFFLGFIFFWMKKNIMQYCNGSWCFINIYIRNYLYFINTDVPVTSCHHKNFNFSSIALLPSSLVTAIIISMFEQIYTLFQYGINRLLILIYIIVWLSATVPHSHFVMCYFNRLSGISSLI